MELENDQVDRRIKESVREFIEIISANKSSPPETEIEQIVTGEEALPDGNSVNHQEYYASRETITIPKPSEVVSEYKKVGSFAETAEYLLSDASSYEYDWDDETEKEYIKKMWIQRLRRVAGETMDYCGTFDFSEAAFDSAFESLLQQYFTSSPSQKIVIPLVNFSGDFEEISLEYPNEITVTSPSSRQKQESINIKSDVKITRISDAERSGMHNATENRNNFLGPLARIQGTHKIEFEVERGSYVIEPVKKQIITLLRLFDPKRPVSLGKEYQFDGGWLFFQDGVPEYTKRPREEGEPGFISSDPFAINEGKEKELVEFWDKYSKFILESFKGERDSNFSRPIQRFSEMYNERKNEDSIIDCFISIEQTILKDIRPSYKFRFPARASLLLNGFTEEKYDSEYIYDFFNQLHHVRNEVIHGDKNIDEINSDVELKPISDSDLESSNFVVIARYFLAKSIIKYMDFDIENGLNITQVNTDVVDPAMKKQLREIPYAETEVLKK